MLTHHFLVHNFAGKKYTQYQYGEIQSPVVMDALKEQISSLGGAPPKKLNKP